MYVSLKKLDFFLIGLLVFCLPFMFHLQVIIQLNASISDIILIFLLFWVFVNKENWDIISRVLAYYHLIIIYVLLLLYFCLVSMINYFTNIFVDYPYGISAVMKLSINFMYVVVFLIYIEKYKEEMLLHVLRWWKYAAVVISILCIGSVLLFRLGIDNGLTLQGRAQATLNDPNLAALYLIVSLAIIALYSLQKKKKIAINLSIFLVLVALFSTASRGGILSIVIGVLVVIFLVVMAGRLKELILFLCLALIGFVIIYLVNTSSSILSFAVERVTNIGSEGDGTSYRVFLWESAIEMWIHNPLIGVGIGQFIAYSQEMFGVTFVNIPHNTYLSFLSETGFLGFAAFIWFPLYLMSKLVLGLISSSNTVFFYLLITLTAIGIQAISINIENIRFIWIFITLAFVLIRNVVNHESSLQVQNLEVKR
ncbi:O-antigen ligase family protein [Ornithinibacillus sp. BX22]|uniref:O-antigen ligase family protein n=2 Tax=Ornithinibacillus TaxID=484508 RepID=A0A923L7P0_9BACI|nr:MULTISPECIES: O-antigen ligase family protein [Ornithinibacillus]MBC5637993.1 O-antigen ligase family protein [Ornithinibacillus hominis]MBS3681881.1 O-antigen ligase family protein [Ornithinibacillus massiliensis]